MLREGSNYASAYSGITSVLLSFLYYARIARGNREMQYAE